jgi:hypothetical protein
MKKQFEHMEFILEKIHISSEICKKILSHHMRTLHLYSLNLEKSVLGILQVLCNIFPDVILYDLSILVGVEPVFFVGYVEYHGGESWQLVTAIHDKVMV